VGPNNSLKPKHLRGPATSLYIVGFTAGYRIFALQISRSMSSRTIKNFLGANNSSPGSGLLLPPLGRRRVNSGVRAHP
jgi:hypothetical protein